MKRFEHSTEVIQINIVLLMGRFRKIKYEIICMINIVYSQYLMCREYLQYNKS
jgi:hypothetical protein